MGYLLIFQITLSQLAANGYQTKTDSKGNIKHFEVRLVAKVFIQDEGVDFSETFSPVSGKDSLELIIAWFAHINLELHQLNVKTAFQNDNFLKKFMCLNLRVLR